MPLFRRSGSVGELHDLDPVELLAGEDLAVVQLEPTAAALVLGSAQPESVIDRAAAAALGFEVCRRRSGGGVVAVVPHEVVWLDVVIAPTHPEWAAQGDATARWLGRHWCSALRAAGHDSSDLTVHAAGLLNRRQAKVLCWAGIGPGEVLDRGVKLVGMSQRRGRWGARLQCQVHLSGQTGAWMSAIRQAAAEVELDPPAVEMAVVSRSVGAALAQRLVESLARSRA